MRTGRWVLAFALSATVAGAMLLATLRAGDVVAPRPASELSDLEVELLLTKLREADLRAIGKDLNGARAAWADVRRRGAGVWSVHEGLGDSLRRAGLGEEALREYATAAELAPPGAPRATIAVKRGLALEGQGRLLDAVRAYLEARSPRVLELAARAGHEEVVRLCRARAEADPRVYALLAELGEPDARARYVLHVEPWNEAGARQALEALKDADLALELCRAWARAVPGSIEPWRRMGDVLRAAGREREALAAYTSMVDVRAGDAAAHRELARVFRELGRTNEAGAQLEAARRARPEDRQIWGELIAHYEGAGQADRAERLLMENFGAVRHDPALRSRYLELRRRQLDRLPRDEAVKLRKSLAAEGFPELGLYDLKVVMTWDAASDVDLDVHEPGGEHVHHGRTESRNGGRYYVDNTTGRGPETYTLAKAPPGTYKVGVHLHGSARSTARVEVVVYEGTDRERRWEGTLTLEASGQQLFLEPFELD